MRLSGESELNIVKTRSFLLTILTVGLLANAVQSQNAQPNSSSNANSNTNTNVTPEKKAGIPDSAQGKKEGPFVFGGGNLDNFVIKVREHYGVNLHQLATIPSDALHQISVPKMKCYGDGSFVSALQTYNGLTKKGVPGIGEWIVTYSPLGNRTDPEAIVFVPPDPKTLQEQLQKMRAFDVREFSENEIKKLEAMIPEGYSALMHANGTPPKGRLQYHQESKIFIAVGEATYLEMVAEFVNVLRERKERKAF